jgi:HPr kinase/phosphorylase
MRSAVSEAETQTLHATCVAVADQGVLILGGSGKGKSALGLELMAFGARLVADDRTIVTRIGSQIIATCPPHIQGLIEARGIGLLQADPVPQARIRLIVDLDQTETDRLPPKRQQDIFAVPIDLVFSVTSRHFPSGILQLLRAKRVD